MKKKNVIRVLVCGAVLLVVALHSNNNTATLLNFANYPVDTLNHAEKEVNDKYNFNYVNHKAYFGNFNTYSVAESRPIENFTQDTKRNTPINQVDALKRAEKVVKEIFPNDNFEILSSKSTNDSYSINFVGRFNNLKDFSNPITIVLDKFGNILSVDGEHRTYEQYNRVQIRSVQRAKYDLPTNLESTVDIRNVNLVYVLENELLQPAYLFTGNFSNGDLFEHFILAEGRSH